MDFSKDLDAVKGIVSPAACYSPETLRSFLRLSRKYSDDSLHTALPRVGSCATHISETLFPAWSARDYILDYCEHVANQSAEQRKQLENSESAEAVPHEKVDPRFDPYGARDFGKQESLPEDSIKSWISKERNVEDIIREDSVRFLANKCGPIFINSFPSTRLATNTESYMEAYKSFKEIHQQ